MKNLKNLNDNNLAQYLKSANLRWIKSIQATGRTNKGTKAFRNAFIKQIASEKVYGHAVSEAISRGTIITH